MARIKKAQMGSRVKSESALWNEWRPANLGAKPTPAIDTAARAKAIKEGRFTEDKKSGDIYPTKKELESKGRRYKAGGKIMKGKKAVKAGVKTMKKKAMTAVAKPSMPMMMKKGGKMKSGGKMKKGY
jgi:hypothetical protein